MKRIIFTILITLFFINANAQEEKPLTIADTLRGSVTPERAWWDILNYNIFLEPNFSKKTISGSNVISYKVISTNQSGKMQIDLQPPMKVDKVVFDDRKNLKYKHQGNVCIVDVPKQDIGSKHQVKVYFSGNPREAVTPPWDGGWSFKTDKKGRPWMTVTCQGLGASVWFPCKDHQSDEPDEGAQLSLKVPNDLVGVANGRLVEELNNNDGTTTYTWKVVNPISTYTLIPNIGHYVNFSETYLGLNGPLDINYWVMDYNLDRAKSYMPKQVKQTLDAFEYWFGPYPFYEDGFKLVDVNYPGMEHQSAVTYGNYYRGGYRDRDLSGTGLGLTFDFIIVHESGHEWFGNNITSNDIADMYVHESFTSYSETLFLDYNYGPEAANDYNFGNRLIIQNDKPIIGPYGVNKRGSGDMYPKGANMLHSIRHSINDDKLFRNILAGLNSTFHNKTVTSSEIQSYISSRAGFDFTNVFEQYLTTIDIPKLELFVDREKNQIMYRYTNCNEGFNLPLTLVGTNETIKIYPTTSWQRIDINQRTQYLFTPWRINYMYYIDVELLLSLNGKM